MIANETISADDWNARRAKSEHARRAQHSGKVFEAYLEGVHDYYRWAKIADVVKLPVPTQPMPRTWLRNAKERGGISRILASRQRADYFGTFGAGLDGALSRLRGRALAMEAKYKADRIASLPILRHDEKGFGLKIHQLEALVTGWRDFGIVGVVVWANGEAEQSPLFPARTRRGERGVLLPPALEQALFDFKVKEARRIPWDAATPYEVVSDGRSGDRWLTPVIEFARSTLPPLLTKRGAGPSLSR